MDLIYTKVNLYAFYTEKNYFGSRSRSQSFVPLILDPDWDNLNPQIRLFAM